MIPSVDHMLGCLSDRGYAIFDLLDSESCARVAAMYGDAGLFRKRIVMEQRAYGRGEYQYFGYPLPPMIAKLREALYPPLAMVANEWQRLLGQDDPYPASLAAYLDQCHAAGQTRPTPLLLRYETGGFNCLHQDIYGAMAFPLQIVVLLSRPGEDFTGGEFLLVEQRPRAQSRAEIVPLRQGQAAVFPVRERPAMGAKRPYRAAMRHGVSRVHSGSRQTLGLIFHDAE